MATDVQAALAGMQEDGARVRVGEIDWARYAQDGALVALHIGRWRAETKLKLEDLGIAPESPEERQAFEKVLKLGSIRLLPERVTSEFSLLHDRARYNLTCASLNTFWGRFIPRKNYAGWAERNRAIREDYLALARQVAEQWDAYQAEMRAEYAVIGAANYAKMARAGLVGDEPQDAWVERFVQNMMRRFPTPEAFVASVTYTWDARYVPLGGQEVLSEAAKDALEADIRATMAREAAEGLDRFVADIQRDIRGRILEAAEAALAALKGETGEGKVAKTGTRKLKSMVERVASLKFWPDEELDRRLAEVAALADVPIRKRETSKLESVLGALAEESRLILRELDRAPRREGKTALLDEPEPEPIGEMAKTARAAKPTLDDGDTEPEAEPALPKAARRGKKALMEAAA